MSKHDTSLSPATSQNAPQHVTRHDGWTFAKQAAFLRQISVTEAAKSVSMSRQSAYRLRSKLKGQG